MSENLFEVIDADDYTATGRIRGQGRRTKEVEAEVKRKLAEEGDVPYQVARARKEHFEAKLKELEYETKLGLKVDRAQVKEACATALASLVQTCRSIGDHLERRHGVEPEVCEVVSTIIDGALDTLAEKFKMLGGE